MGSSPVAFGSITNWKVYEMIPTQAYALIQARDKVLQNPDIMDSPANLLTKQDLDYYLGLLLDNMSPDRAQRLLEEMPEYINILN